MAVNLLRCVSRRYSTGVSGLQNGTILLIVLIFFLLLSLLASSALNGSYLQLRMSQNYAAAAQAFEAAEAGLRFGEKKLLATDHPICLQGEKGYKNCYFSYKTYSVFYTIKKQRGVSSCLLPMNKLGAFYTVTASAKHLNDPEIVLESSYAKPTQQACVGGEPLVGSGRMAWRQIA